MRPLSLIFLTTAVIATGYFCMKRKPRNVRNKNPLNIKKSADWDGERLLSTDSTFEQFKTEAYGFRAGYIDLLQKLERGVNTVESVISVWAPAPINSGDDHNETASYIEYVADAMGVSEFQELSPNDLPDMMLAMSEFEGGKGHFTIEQANDGMLLAKQELFVLNRLERMEVVV